jgi:hypothetical protein
VTFVPLSAQERAISFGVKGGVPITAAFDANSFFTIDFGEGSSSATRRYIVGPEIELRLPHGFGFELDALYNRLGFADVSKSIGVVFTFTQTSANSWTFPLMAKYRLPSIHGLHTFVNAGPSFRTVSGVSMSTTTVLEFGSGQVTGPIHHSSDPHLDSRSHAGIAAGFGAKFRAGLLNLSPEIRYSRWRTDGPNGSCCNELSSNPNQVDFLFGITF